jgi:hypothetical protein
MKVIQKDVSPEQMAKLLLDLKTTMSDVRIRVRLVGEMWDNIFMRVVQADGKGALLLYEEKNKMIMVSDVTSIMQFELDGRFQHYQPFFHYNLKV